jgi:hypothetical protein
MGKVQAALPHKETPGMTRSTFAALLSAAATAALLALQPAAACACCSERGQRTVGSATLEEFQWAEIERIRFAAKAELFTGGGEMGDVPGLAKPDTAYALTVARDGRKLTFTFKGETQGSGTLALTLPDTASFFEVDPRDATEANPEPSLYKEWKFSGEPTGTGDFAAGAGAGQTLTLILQGRGNNCAAAEDFTHWSLVLEGPKGEYLLFGDLAPAQ